MVVRECPACPELGRSLFATLDDDGFHRLVEAARIRPFAAGETLCREGGTPRAVSCLVRGRAKRVRTGENGQNQLVQLMGPPHLWGLRSLVAGQEFSSDAVALTDGEAAAVPADLVGELLRGSPAFALATMRLLAQRLRVAEDFLMVMTQRRVRRRVADVLLLLDGRDIPGDRWEPLPRVRLKRKEIAEMVGTTPETLSRVLAEFAERRLIRLTRTRLDLLDPAGLQNVAREDRAAI